MALLPVVEITEVVKDDTGVKVVASLTLDLNGTPVLTKEFSAHFRPGIDDGVKVDIQDVLIKKMQKAIDEYKEGDTMASDPRVKRLKKNIESGLKV